MNSHPLDQIEQRNKRIAALITAGVVGLLFLMLVFWVVYQGSIPPEDENQYVTVGTIDFGNLSAGSSNVKQFTDPAPEPADVEQTGTETQATNPTAASQEDPVISGGDETTTPPPSESTADDTPTDAEESGGADNSQAGGGANEGDEETIGDAGASILPVDGSVEFESGRFGLNNRKLLAYQRPNYPGNAQGRVTFIIKINPNGTVQDVVSGPDNPLLVKAGKTAIRRWRFNPVNSSTVQKVKVTLVFKQQ